MKRGTKKTKSVSKGAPSGFVISLLVHAAAFMLAGLLVVFTVTQKEEKKFVPPKPVDRPKMKLKKPKVQVKKESKPQSSSHIVTKVTKANMPDIQLPEMTGGIGEGFGEGGYGGFDLMPDLSEITMFGSEQTIGNDFVGTFYDLKRGRSGNTIAMDEYQYADELTKFCNSGWKDSALAKFYRSPRKLYTTTFAVPHVPSSLAPFAFGEPNTIACQWAVHYKGMLVYPEDIKFRFWGQGDDVLVVRVGGKIVLDASIDSARFNARSFAGKWVSSATKNRQWYLGNTLAWGGDWIELKAGEPLEMDVLIGEQPGGQFCAMLLVEVDGVEYETNPQNQKLLPIFRTSETTRPIANAIMEHLVPGEADVLGGPIFRDYMANPQTKMTEEVVQEEVEPTAPKEEDKMRVWTLVDGKSVEAEFISRMGDQLVLRDARGRQVKIPQNQVSQEDIDYIILSKPPKFDVGIVRSSKNFVITMSNYALNRNQVPPTVLDWTFGAKARQKSGGDYPFELKLEYYAIGQQRLDADKYKVLDHNSATFVPSKENKGSFDFKSDRVVRLFDFDLIEQRRGIKLAETLVLLTDSRGKIIAHSSTANWLYDNLDELRKREVGDYIDKKCQPTYASGPRQNPSLY
jgi:hypothetical protein